MEAKEIEGLVGELELRVDRLRSLYDQYFMGIERVAPSVPHKDVERRIYVMRKEQIRNTAVRFRFQMIIQRYNTYQTHWQRICRQIEEGTYKRDLLRAQRRMAPPAVAVAAAPSEPPPSSVPVATAPASQPLPQSQPHPHPPLQLDGLELDDFGDLDRVVNAPTAPAIQPKLGPRPVWRKKEAPAAAPAAAPNPLPKAPPPPPAPKPQAKPPPLPARRSPADLSDDRLRQLYSQYVQTKRSQNESTAALSYDEMARSLRESSAKLREKHGKAVDFEVAVKEGKTVLRPVVKR